MKRVAVTFQIIIGVCMNPELRFLVFHTRFAVIRQTCSRFMTIATRQPTFVTFKFRVTGAAGFLVWRAIQPGVGQKTRPNAKNSFHHPLTPQTTQNGARHRLRRRTTLGSRLARLRALLLQAFSGRLRWDWRTRLWRRIKHGNRAPRAEEKSPAQPARRIKPARSAGGSTRRCWRLPASCWPCEPLPARMEWRFILIQWVPALVHGFFQTAQLLSAKGCFVARLRQPRHVAARHL